jgi:hypothetical protein
MILFLPTDPGNNMKKFMTKVTNRSICFVCLPVLIGIALSSVLFFGESYAVTAASFRDVKAVVWRGAHLFFVLLIDVVATARNKTENMATIIARFFLSCFNIQFK